MNNRFGIVLNKEQTERLYNVFDFEDTETITLATYENNNKLCIFYTDKDGIQGCYEPDLDKNNNEDITKLNYIFKGENK